MRDFDRSFKRTRNVAIGMFIFNTIVILGMFALGIIVLYNIFTNPEGVGEFFGRIVSGFQSIN
ncbi:MAG: hypothetical protein ACOC22_01595 [bacterium]